MYADLRLPATGFALAFLIGAPPAGATCTLAKNTTLPLTVSGPRLYVPVSINGNEGLFLVDTGAETTILTADFAARAHVGMDIHAGQVTMGGVGGGETLPVNQAHARRINVGTIAFQDWEFAVVPPEAGGLGKTQHDGILGMDFLHYFDIDVDVQGSQLTLWRIFGCHDIHPVWQGDYDAIPLQHTAHQSVTMPIFVDDAFLNVEFDTGAYELLLTHDAGLKAGFTDAMAAADWDPGGRGIGGGFPSVVHRFKLLLVGKSEFHNPAIAVELKSPRESFGDGIMNWRYLNARRFWISYATNTLFVQQAAAK